MNVWAISDLHLSFARPDRRERYAARWRDHAVQIETNWRARVGTGDLVLLPGDLSMARNHRDVQPDLAWLHKLPGTKVLAPGNHDQWWNGAQKIRPLLRDTMLAVDGDAIESHGVIVCGTAARCRHPIPPRTTIAMRWNAASKRYGKRSKLPSESARTRVPRSSCYGITPRSTPTDSPALASRSSSSPV